MEIRPEPLRVKWENTAVHKGPYAVLLCFWSVFLLVQLLHPARTLFCFLEIKKPSMEYAFGVHLAEIGFQDLRPWIQLLQCAAQHAKLVFRHHVSFVQYDDIGELHLIGQQIHNGSVVAGDVRQVSVYEGLRTVKVLGEMGGIDHRCNGVHIAESAEINATLFIDERKRLGHRNRLADARALNEEVIKPILSGQAFHLLHQIFA